MKKLLCIILSIAVCGSLVCFSGCSQLDIAEQPEPVVIYAEKIYPSAIGNYLTDASVDMPSIDAYMEEYNKNADETARINYDVIKYNEANAYYYVNDNKTDIGIKFRVDQAGTICSASIYTGTLEQNGKSVYNVVVNAIETAGYKTLMTDADRAVIQHTLNGFNSVAESKNEVMQIFNGQENFSAKWNNAVAEFEIPVKPSELPKPDTSHTLESITFPTVEIPEITLDTTIVEGVHIANGVEVKQQDIDSIVDKIQAANKEIAEVEAYNKTTPEGVNAVLDDIVLNRKELEANQYLESAQKDILALLQSSETAKLPVTEELTGLLQESYQSFYNATFPGYSNDRLNDAVNGGTAGVTSDASSFIDAIIGGKGTGSGGGHLVVNGEPTQNAKDSIGAIFNDFNDLGDKVNVDIDFDQEIDSDGFYAERNQGLNNALKVGTEFNNANGQLFKDIETAYGKANITVPQFSTIIRDGAGKYDKITP